MGGFVMRKKLQVETIEINKEKLFLHLDQTYSLEGVTPKEQMLADSDGLAFIYIAEEKDEYIYISIPEKVWPQLKKGLESDYSVFLKGSEQDLELTGFNEELRYLISNIEGNSNYGEEMVNKVENIFK
jgi:hypothetical protein